MRLIDSSRQIQGWLLAVACCAASPLWVSAQTTASITGTVRDTTGAVLPGVTAEASSPALIEKTRVAVTDGTGRFRIIDLRPGVYAVTFTLAGFGTVRREGLQLTAGFTATLNEIELGVGDVTETVTVTGASPVVDVQSTRQVEVMSRDVIDTIPTSREFQAIALLVPGMMGRNADTDVGGQAGQTFQSLSIHGSNATDMKYYVDGYDMQGGTARAANNFQFMDGNYQEYVLETAANTAEAALGGVRITLVPKEGGNTFRGTFFADLTNKNLASKNITDELRRAGLRDPNNVKRVWRVHPTFGGPLRQDKLWFYLAASRMVNEIYVANRYYNLTPNTMLYRPDFSQQAVDPFWNNDATARLTWQATPRQKVTYYYEYQRNCHCVYQVGPANTPDGAWYMDTTTHVNQITWSAPLSNRLLLTGGVMQWPQVSTRSSLPGTTVPRITDTALGFSYGSGNQASINTEPGTVTRASMSYVTGAHAFKVGFSNSKHNMRSEGTFPVPYWYTFNNGVPTAVTYLAENATDLANMPFDLGIFALDQWTLKRATFNYGIRYDYLKYGYPETTFPATSNVPVTRVLRGLQKGGFKDLSPRFGVAFDLFGTGKTALKASVNRYVGVGLSRLTGAKDALGRDTRSWTDLNGNFIVDADHTNPAANGELGPRTNGRFADVVTPVTYDADYNLGFGTRAGANWEMSGSFQHEILPRVSLNAAYIRRAYTTFEISNNRAVRPADYSTYCVVTPLDARLPGGGGQRVCGLFDLNPSAVGRTDPLVTSAGGFGGIRKHFNGVDLTTDARFSGGSGVQGGLSWGKMMEDTCDLAKEPQVTTQSSTLSQLPQPVVSTTVPKDFCHTETPFLSQLRVAGYMTLPAGFRMSATFKDVQGEPISANVVFSSAQVAGSLGRPLSAASNVVVNVIEPGTLYTDRFRQLDLRLAKLFRIGERRFEGMFDIYNVLNTNTVTTVNNTYGTNGAVWLQPLGIVPARLIKIGVQVNF